MFKDLKKKYRESTENINKKKVLLIQLVFLIVLAVLLCVLFFGKDPKISIGIALLFLGIWGYFTFKTRNRRF